MGKIASGIKRHKQSLKRRARNRHVRSTVKTIVKEVRAGIEESAEKGAELLVQASSVIAKAGSKGVIHKKTASRKISRLAKAIAKAGKKA
ncbi:MAG: 30S ribosomal protein S20 [Thermodesulfobacteriota bacterium]